MKPEERKAVNKDQINKFFESYYSEWRHIKILAIEKTINTKYEFFQDIIETVKKTDTNAGEHTIAQEITNGLMFDAIQHSIQYIEDLFALISATQNEDTFIRNIIKYKAGTVTNQIRNPKLSRNDIFKQFHFPICKEADIREGNEKDKEVLKVIAEGVDKLSNILKEVSDYYNKYEFFYNQYKHGLTVALRPYADYDVNRVAIDKAGEDPDVPVVALDNLNFVGALNNQEEEGKYLLIPHFTQNIQKHMDELQKENNLLRFVMTPKDYGMEEIKSIAYKTKRCMHILIGNFLQLMNESEKVTLRLPAPEDSLVYEFTSLRKPDGSF